jgi:hypothetical protein
MKQSEEAPAKIWSDSERAVIVQEMDQILADSAFKGSKRCQALLRRLVEQALSGERDGIKERTLGVDVFGREASYDTASDPVVRVTANDIRKRLAQWYQESNRHHEVRIRLLAGSYCPKFDFSSPAATPEASEGSPAKKAMPHHEGLGGVAVSTAEGAGVAARESWRRRVVWIAGCLVVLIAAALTIRFTLFESSEFKVWAPLTVQQEPLTLCISDEDWGADAQADGVEPSQEIARTIASRVVSSKNSRSVFTATYPVIDAFLANKITDTVALHGKQTILKRSSELSFDDLRHQPVVVIGGYNPWSLILLSKLRFSLWVDPVTHETWIQDLQNPGSRKWGRTNPTGNAEADYAIVSRFRDPETGQWIISLSGLGADGTISACSLLTDAEYAYMLPPAFKTQQNAQLVLKTNVINGNPGPPQVIATHTW